jgi:hypothetical protein
VVVAELIGKFRQPAFTPCRDEEFKIENGGEGFSGDLKRGGLDGN